MLELKVGEKPYFDEKTSKIIRTGGSILQLEHSLVSISKWESKWHKPFLTAEQKTIEETIDYIKCMTLNIVKSDIYDELTKKDIDSIVEYMEDPMTATWFTNKQSTTKKDDEIITSEIIYYWIAEAHLPIESQYWHINRLLTLIRVSSIKNQKQTKMSKKDVYSRQAALNKARRPHK